MNDLLRGQRQVGFSAQLVIPRQSQMLLNLPIPVRSLEPPVNGRSTLMRLGVMVQFTQLALMYARLILMALHVLPLWQNGSSC